MNNRLQGFTAAFMSKERHLGQPRQASHKLNKRQQKANCGYKEISAKPRGYGMARDKTFGNIESSGICATPAVMAKKPANKAHSTAHCGLRKAMTLDQAISQELAWEKLKAKT